MKRGRRGIGAMVTLVASLVLPFAGVAAAQQAEPSTTTTTAPGSSTPSTSAPSSTTSTTSAPTTTSTISGPSTTTTTAGPAPSAGGASSPDSTPPSSDPGVVAQASDPIPGHYLVTLRTKDKKKVGPDVARVTKAHGGKVNQVWGDALQGYAAEMTPAEAAAVAGDPAVERVEQDQVVHTQTTEEPLGYTDPIKTTGCTLSADAAHPGYYLLATTPMQNGPDSWGLDRIDQATPLVYAPTSKSIGSCSGGRWSPANPTQNAAGSYKYQADGAGVHAYVIDTGINPTNTDFGGRASVGDDEVGDGQNGIDCAGHGTHVAGTIGGTRYGVAKQVQLVAVRVLDCSGSGTDSDVISGINWVVANAVRPAVANMSLGGGYSQTLNDAVAAAVASGITFGVAAGNNSNSTTVQDACATSPSSEPSAITVGASTFSQADTSSPSSPIVDDRAYYSNGGGCVDLFAPGSNIKSDWIGGATATNIISGTSMATPHVVGVAALYLSNSPCATPAQVATAIVGNAVNGAILGKTNPRPSLTVFDTNAQPAPNKLLNMQFVGADAAPVAPCAPPQAVVASRGNQRVQLQWQAPSNGLAAASYKILRGTTPNGESLIATTGHEALSYLDDGTDAPAPLNGTTYYYKVVPTNAAGDGPASSEVSTAPVDWTGTYVPLTPSRILDSRVGTGLNGAFTNGTVRTLQVTGRGGVPSSGVTAVVMNVTVTNASSAGFATAYPSGASAPNASNLNFVAGQTVPNLVTVGLSPSGGVNLVVTGGPADLVADVQGFYAGPTYVAFAGATGSKYHPSVPTRILDTRAATHVGNLSTWGPRTTRDITLTGVPADATAVAVNVTVTNPSAASWATLYPSGVARPDPASTLNFVAGQTVPNFAIVKIGANGMVSLYNLAGNADFIVDVVGWYGGSLADSIFTPIDPTRILDSRPPPFNVGGNPMPFTSDNARDVQVTNGGTIPSGAVGAVMNVTVTDAAGPGHVIVWPADAAQPDVSNLNFTTGLTVPNLVMVKLAGDGTVDMLVHGGPADLIADVVGYFTVPGP
jgi:subtilisin family serine protease